MIIELEVQDDRMRELRAIVKEEWERGRMKGVQKDGKGPSLSTKNTRFLI